MSNMLARPSLARSVVSALTAVALLLAAVSPALAHDGPSAWGHWKKHGHHKHHGHHRHKHKHHGHDHDDDDDDDDNYYPYYADDDYDDDDYDDYDDETVVYRDRPVPYGIDRGHCNRALIGGLVGAAAGGFIGSEIADRDDQAVGIIGGLVIGAIIGGAVGHSMDQADRRCVGYALEYGEPSRPVRWSNPNGAEYSVVPYEPRQTSAGYCREYQTTIVVGGRTQNGYGTACRQPDGNWRIVG